MKATRLYGYGDVDQLKYEEVADPVPGVGEVLVKVEASSLNPIELYIRQGFVKQMAPLELPATLGLDLAGTIAAVGAGVATFSVGDRVIGKLPINGKGSNAELVVTEPKYLARLSERVSFIDGATLPLAGLTGRQAVDAAGVKAGDRVLVTGALGAVGRAAVQYLKELGAIPVAGVRASRIDEAKTLGIEAVGMDEAGAQGRFDGAVSAVGGPVTAAAIKLVRDGGTLATVVGAPEGANSDGRIKLVHVLAKENAAMLQKVADAAANEKLSIPVARTFPLSQVGEGHKMLAAGQTGGKIVFTL